MSYRQSLSQDLTYKLDLHLPFETAGDLELFSLHRIKNRIKSLKISPDLKIELVKKLLKENVEYKEDSGNDWNCITPSSLGNSVDHLVDYLTQHIDLGLQTIDDLDTRLAIEDALTTQKEEQISLVKHWFADNYDQLIYDQKGRIPFPIVKAMRNQLSIWAISNLNPFSKPIGELIEETAKSVGIDTDGYNSYEDIWNDLKDY